MQKSSTHIEVIKKALIPLENLKDIPQEGLRPAAVLLPLIWWQGQWNLLYIHRSEIGEYHRGEVAFPGGGREITDENLVATALREVNEELGIDQKLINVIGFLHSVPTISNYFVTPIVGVVDWPTQIRMNVEEVTRSFIIPIKWLMDPMNWESRELDIPGRGKVEVIVYREFDGEILWGLTARITHEFLELLNK